MYAASKYRRPSPRLVRAEAHREYTTFSLLRERCEQYAGYN